MFVELVNKMSGTKTRLEAMQYKMVGEEGHGKVEQSEA